MKDCMMQSGYRFRSLLSHMPQAKEKKAPQRTHFGKAKIQPFEYSFYYKRDKESKK